MSKLKYLLRDQTSSVPGLAEYCMEQLSAAWSFFSQIRSERV